MGVVRAFELGFEGWVRMGKDGGLWEGGVALNFVHPPACFARVPLRGAKGGVVWFVFSGFPRARE